MESFAFILHPIKHSDILRKFPFFKYCPEKFLKEVFRRFPPFKVSQIEGVESPYNRAGGWFVACPLSSDQMLNLPRHYVLNKIIQAGSKAESLGAKVVGLGALAAVVGDAGITVSQNLNIPVTTGNSYTVATAYQGAREAANKLGLELADSRVSVLGATGSIGKVIAKKAARETEAITLMGRNLDKLESIAQQIYQDNKVTPRVTNDIEQGVEDADVVFAVSGSDEALIRGDELKPGAVVCDVARPRDVSYKVAKNREDVLVIEGGVVEVPGNVEFNFNFGFPPKMAYACMAETMILALEQRYESYTLGRELTLSQVDEIDKLAEKHGFKLAGLRSFEKPLSEDKIKKVKEKTRDQKKYALRMG